MATTPGRKPVEEIMKYCDEEAVQTALLEWISALERLEFIDRAIHTADLLKVCKRLETLNFIGKRWEWSSKSYVKATPTSTAMEYSLTFVTFRSLLRELALDTEDFVRKEVEVWGHGWTEATLLAVFNDDYKPHRINHLSCYRCDRFGDWIPYERDWLWDQRLTRAKAGQDLDGPFSNEELRVQEEWKLYVDTYVNDHLCGYCQDGGSLPRKRVDWLSD